MIIVQWWLDNIIYYQLDPGTISQRSLTKGIHEGNGFVYTRFVIYSHCCKSSITANVMGICIHPNLVSSLRVWTTSWTADPIVLRACIRNHLICVIQLCFCARRGGICHFLSGIVAEKVSSDVASNVACPSALSSSVGHSDRWDRSIILNTTSICMHQCTLNQRVVGSISCEGLPTKHFVLDSYASFAWLLKKMWCTYYRTPDATLTMLSVIYMNNYWLKNWCLRSNT